LVSGFSGGSPSVRSTTNVKFATSAAMAPRPATNGAASTPNRGDAQRNLQKSLALLVLENDAPGITFVDDGFDLVHQVFAFDLEFLVKLVLHGDDECSMRSELACAWPGAAYTCLYDSSIWKARFLPAVTICPRYFSFRLRIKSTCRPIG
jgi:hypothetical protein